MVDSTVGRRYYPRGMRMCWKYLTLLLISASLTCCSVNSPRERENRSKVRQLVKVGDDLSASVNRLRREGFPVTPPCFPTKPRDYQNAIITVGQVDSARHDFHELTGILIGPNDSPYVILYAKPDGRIYKMEFAQNSVER